MPREWESRTEAEVDATPEQVWEAIATGRGVDSWFMGRNQVEPGEGGAVRVDVGGFVLESTVTEWDPPTRFAHRSVETPDKRFIAYEYLIEGRDQGSTVLRLVASGFLPGDDWEAEYDALLKGGAMYFRTLVEYLTHFPGRTATSITAYGPPVTDWTGTWAGLHAALGLTGTTSEGDLVRVALDGIGPIDGVVDYATPETLGVRTDDGLYRFIRGFFGTLVIGHHLFSDVDQSATEQAWQSWLSRTFARLASLR